MKRVLALFSAFVMVICALPLWSVDTAAAFEGEDKINIVLDPGHGGYNIGTATSSNIAEKDYNFKLAGLIRDHLVANGNFNVYMTRTGDYDLELYQRAEVANNYNADLLISVHFDGNVIRSMRGVTAYTSVLDKYAAVSLSRSITSALSSATGLSNNGVSRRKDNQGYYWNTEKQWDCQDSSLSVLSDYYGIPTWCAKFGIPSIIVEHGFFSNSADVSIITAPGTLEKMAKAEADAIIAHYTNHNHVYGTSMQDFPSNCVYTGKQSERCSVCGHRRNVISLEADHSNHYWVTKQYVPASCGKDGKIVRECRITQNLSDKGWTGTVHTSTEIIPAPTDHTFQLTTEKAATHTVNGYKQFKCKTCSYTYKEILYAEGHTYVFLSYKEPTCTETGGNTYKCEVCSHQYTDKENAKGHRFTVTETVYATCTEEGHQNSKCTVCGYETTEKYEPLGHKLPADCIVDSDCENDGYKKGRCTRCGIEIDEIIEKKGHDMVTVSEEAPACDKDGHVTRICSRCDLEESTVTPAIGHTMTESVTTPPTCETGGEKTYTCSVCGYTKKEAVKAIGHNKGKKGKVVLEATLFSEGKTEFACKNGCGKVFTEKTPSVFKENIAYFIAGGVSFIVTALVISFVIILLKRRKNEAAEDNDDTENKDSASVSTSVTETEETLEDDGDSAETEENEPAEEESQSEDKEALSVGSENEAE